MKWSSSIVSDFKEKVNHGDNSKEQKILEKDCILKLTTVNVLHLRLFILKKKKNNQEKQEKPYFQGHTVSKDV